MSGPWAGLGCFRWGLNRWRWTLTERFDNQTVWTRHGTSSGSSKNSVACLHPSSLFSWTHPFDAPHYPHSTNAQLYDLGSRNKDSTPRIQEIIVLYRIYHSFPSSSNASSIVNSRHTLNQKVSFQQPSLDFVDLTLPRRQLLKSTMTLYLHWTQACRLHFCFLISVRHLTV